VRRLNGTALTIDTVALLDIPFFLDPATFYEHCTAVFAHNARLARAVRTGFPRPSLRVGRTWRRAGHLRDHSRRDDPAVDQRPLPIGDAPRGEEYERPQPFSMPTFFDPGYDHRVACVPSCRPAHGEPRYRACTVAEHMREMAHTTLSTAEPILAV
jgi:hypothetical protein